MVMRLAWIRREHDTLSHRWMRMGAVMDHHGTMSSAATGQYWPPSKLRPAIPNVILHRSIHFSSVDCQTEPAERNPEFAKTSARQHACHFEDDKYAASKTNRRAIRLTNAWP